MIERLYYLLLMSGGKMIRRIRAAPSTLFSAVGGLTRGAVSAAESITQTRVSAKGELLSQEYRYTAVAKMQIHAAAIATTAVETLEGAAKTVLAATATPTTVETLEGAAKTALAATAAVTRAERQDISGQSNDGFRGIGKATPLWVEKLESVTASALRAVGIATTDSFVVVAGRSGAVFATNAIAKLISVVTVPGYLQMAAAAIGNLSQVSAPVSAAAFAATAAIGVLYNRPATALTGRSYTAMSARGTLLGNTNTLHGVGSTMADANGQAQLLTGRMAASRTSTAVSAQGTADAHATRRGRADTEVSAAGQAVVDATKRGRAGTFVSAIAAAVRTETSRSRPETVVSAAANATIAQNAASDTKTAVRAQGSITTAILRYVSATASVAAEAVGNATADIVRLAGYGATAVLSVGRLMLQNFRGGASTTVSAAGQITQYQGQWVDGKTKTKASAVGSLTAVEARALQGRVKALVAAAASAVTSGTQRAFTGTILSAQGVGTVLSVVIRGTAGTILSAQGIGTVLSRAMIQGAAGTGVSATATATYQALLLRGSTSTAGSATGSASVNAWFIYNSETQDLYIRQTVSANQNGSRLTVLNHYPHTND